MKRFLMTLVVVVALPAAGANPAPRVVEIVAKRFEFTPKELTLTAGEPVTLRLRSEDVVHGFFLRALKVDTEVQPGKTTEITVTPEKAGTFTAICHHYCGSGHGGMKMKVIVAERSRE